MSVEKPLELEFAPANPCRFVPVDFGQAHGAIAEFYPSYTLPLPPACASIVPPKPGNFTYPGTGGNCFDVSDSTENPEVHGLRVLGVTRKVKPPSNETRISCSLWRPQTLKISSSSSGRHGLSASCAG